METITEIIFYSYRQRNIINTLVLDHFSDITTYIMRDSYHSEFIPKKNYNYFLRCLSQSSCKRKTDGKCIMIISQNPYRQKLKLIIILVKFANGHAMFFRFKISKHLFKEISI